MAKPTLILVDDQVELRKELFTALQEDFDIVEECATGEEAVAAVQRHKPLLVLMDVVMPRMSGIEACARIHQGAKPHPTIVMMSGLKDENVVLQAMQAGAVDYLVKPLRGEQVARILNSLLAELSTTSEDQSTTQSQKSKPRS